MAGRQRPRRRRAGGRVLLAALLLLGLCCRAAPERIRYAIPEELGRGSLVGPLARDLGLSPAELPARKLRLSAEKQYFGVSGESGQLYVSERLDREEMCGEAASCSVSFEALLHNPLNVFHVQVDIHDVNDNAPRFLRDSFQLEINELTSPGAHFYLGMAEDPDVGSNALQGYELEDNKYFAVEVKEKQDGRKFAELVLRRALDRESEQSLRLVLTALDGGDPPRSGTAQLCINVTDANDNAPVFAQDRYRVSVREDAPPRSTVLNVSAWDADAGSNARITYGFGETPAKVLEKFVVDAESGTITLQETLDFEDSRAFSLAVEAKDGGGLVAHCEVEVEVLDVNDNAPEVTFTSVSSPVPEDAPVGTVVALQAQPNTDWRFSQTQRPGTSGSQNGEEGGAWPNNQFDTEMLQAMILASANEAADANSTLGGGTGTMGLSARYGPQFTLQHVPDYRQNVYIPGSTATLTNAAGKRDAKATNPSGGNKKKSGKKEKK
ncbi:protocadherin gamma-B5-like isoform X17 [Apus apus]|uniref:protocadherin gamma-B5-like isoform X17 n=1 Tax=Apus apus TaxID=8895 RepID=UPI0021F87236|nr:protocadherin gamma-B5-like isoform X17 [Apus apus]